MTLAKHAGSGLFWAWAIGGTLAALIFLGAARSFNRDAATRQLDADAFRAPINHLMTVIGILLPLLVAAMAYLFERNPSVVLGVPLAAAALMLIGFGISTWLTYALLSRTKSQGIVELKLPADWLYLGAPGAAYACLIVSIAGVVYFFIFQFQPGPVEPLRVAAQPMLIERAMPRLGMQRNEVTQLLGAPIIQEADASMWSYRTQSATLELKFGADGKVARIAEEAR